MTEELSGRRVVVPETRELGQLVRMLEELGAFGTHLVPPTRAERVRIGCVP